VDNAAADALSRLTTSGELNAIVLSSIKPDLLKEVKTSWVADVDIQLLIHQLETIVVPNRKFHWVNGELRRNGKGASELKEVGFYVILERDVQSCQDVCKKDISMDFIDGFASSQRKTVIFVIVDRLSKYAHIVALSHPYTATQVDKVDRTLTAWEEAINVLKFHLRRARDRMKAIADGHKSNRTYEE
ncbi:reverse transcriptase, partial [Tanacetum coccineum]